MCDILPSIVSLPLSSGSPALAIALDPHGGPSVAYRPGDVVCGTVYVDRGKFPPSALVTIEIAGEERAVSHDAETLGEYKRESRREICRGTAASAPSPPSPRSSEADRTPRRYEVPFRASLPPRLPGTVERTASRLHPESHCEVRYFVRASVVARRDPTEEARAATGCGVGEFLGGGGGGGVAISVVERPFTVMPSATTEERDASDAGKIWVTASPDEATGALCCDSPLGPPKPNNGGGDGGETSSVQLLGLDVDRTALSPGQRLRVGVTFAEPETCAARLRSIHVQIEERTEWTAEGRMESRTDVLAQGWLDPIAASACEGDRRRAACSLQVPSRAGYAHLGDLVTVTHELRVSLMLQPEGMFCNRQPEMSLPLRIVPSSTSPPARGNREDAEDAAVDGMDSVTGDNMSSSGGTGNDGSTAVGGRRMVEVEVSATSWKQPPKPSGEEANRDSSAADNVGVGRGDGSVFSFLTACCAAGH